MINRLLLPILISVQLISTSGFAQTNAFRMRNLEQKFDELIRANAGLAEYVKLLETRIENLEKTLETEREHASQLRQDLRAEKDRRRVWEAEYLRALFPARNARLSDDTTALPLDWPPIETRFETFESEADRRLDALAELAKRFSIRLQTLEKKLDTQLHQRR